MEMMRKRYPDVWGGEKGEFMADKLRVLLTDDRDDERDYRTRPEETEQTTE